MFAILTVLTPAFVLRSLAGKGDKAYATILGIVVGMAAAMTFSGLTIDDILNQLDRMNGLATTSDRISPPSSSQ